MKKKRAKQENYQKSTGPTWFVFSLIVLMTLMVCVAVNLRAYSELSAEMDQHQKLNAELEELTGENQMLQKEVKSLKTDTRMIEREARKIGMGRPNEKILVPGN